MPRKISPKTSVIRRDDPLPVAKLEDCEPEAVIQSYLLHLLGRASLEIMLTQEKKTQRGRGMASCYHLLVYMITVCLKLNYSEAIHSM